jgi:hypothetical protein
MTKQELLNELKNKFKSVDIPVLANPTVKYDGGK